LSILPPDATTGPSAPLPALERTLLRDPVPNGDNHHRGEITLKSESGFARRVTKRTSQVAACSRSSRKRHTLDSPVYIPVLVILIAMAIGSVGAFFVLPPLLDRIDRVGKVGIFGF
jgi:hypothetical protein